jgi:replicative DNA helicase
MPWPAAANSTRSAVRAPSPTYSVRYRRPPTGGTTPGSSQRRRSCGDPRRREPSLLGVYAVGRGGEQADDIAGRLEKAAGHVRDVRHVDSIRRIGDIAREVLKGKKSGDVTRVRTGLRDLDDLCTGGLPIGQTTMIAAKPGMGKSLLGKQSARNIAEGIGAQAAVPAGIITIEETGPKIATNYLSAIGQVVNSRIVKNAVDEQEWGRLEGAADAVDELPVFVDDAQRALSDIQRVARRMVRKHGCRVIIVDHLHLIDGETDANREQELSRISGGLKSLWKELGVVGVELLQVNRGGEREAVPEWDQLRGSGSLEADGDLIIQLHRQDYFDWKKNPYAFVPTHQLCAFVNKNKDGPVGRWTCTSTGTFSGSRIGRTHWGEGRLSSPAPRTGTGSASPRRPTRRPPTATGTAGAAGPAGRAPARAPRGAPRSPRPPPAGSPPVRPGRCRHDDPPPRRRAGVHSLPARVQRPYPVMISRLASDEPLADVPSPSHETSGKLPKGNKLGGGFPRRALKRLRCKALTYHTQRPRLLSELLGEHASRRTVLNYATMPAKKKPTPKPAKAKPGPQAEPSRSTCRGSRR